MLSCLEILNVIAFAESLCPREFTAVSLSGSQELKVPADGSPGTTQLEAVAGRRSPGASLPTEEELRKLREETNSEMLRQELDRERQRRIELEQKVQEVLKAR